MSAFPTRILLATDGSGDVALAARAAADLCGKAGSELHVVHVWQGVPTWPDPPAHGSLLRELEARELLEEQVERLEEYEATVAGAHLRWGKPADEIVGLAEELRVGLVLVGSRGLGCVKRLIMGSVSRSVVCLASCPTLVIRGGTEAWPPASVVIGDNSSEGARRAGDLATSIGRLFEVQVFLVRTGYPEPQLQTSEWSRQTQRERAAIARMYESRRIKRALEKRADALEKVSDRRPYVRGAVGDAAAVVLKVARESEQPALIAVGRRGLGTVQSALLGSVSRKILNAASGPVLIDSVSD